jgi:chemotaxis protein MotB
MAHGGGKRRRAGGGHEGGGHDAAGGLRWLLTYADMITLLLIMFIILYSAAAQDTQKMKMLAMYLRATFGGVLQQGPTFLSGSGDAPIPDLYQKLQSSVQAIQGQGEMGEGAVQVVQEERGIVVRMMTDNVMFDRGSIDLQEQTKQVLDAISPVLKETNRPVLVEGHTCNLPVRGGRFKDNWELSTARASAVVRYLVDTDKVPPRLMSAAGYGEFRPLLPNTSEAMRQRNRRIDIVILNGPASKEAGGKATQ